MPAITEKRAAPPAAERITVALTTRAARELEELQDQLELNKTDVVNRALSLYRLVEGERAEGSKIAFFDPESERVRIVEIL
jgi:hypothetical protein